jgi:calcineurin-like phosphoesterase family protein
MNEGLISNWNAVVQPSDVVWILGDVFFCESGQAKEIMYRLHGRKRLIYGNHDKMIRNQVPIQQLFERIYPELHQEYIDGVLVSMCHYPMLSWNKAFHGAYMLHGHVHNNVACDGVYRRYDVGVDANNYTPVSWQEIRRVLEAIKPTDSRDR